MKSESLPRIIQNSLNCQVKAVSDLKKSTKSIEKATELLHKRKGKIIVTGVGKSAFIGMKMAATLTSLGEHAHFLHPVDALHGDSGMAVKGDVLIAFSYSGESKEVVKISEYLSKAHKIPIIAICGKSKSSIAKISDVFVQITIGEEGSPLNLAPMASTSASLVAGDLIANALAVRHDFEASKFAKAHPGGALGLRLMKVREIMLSGNSLPIVSESKSLKDALIIMNEKGRGIIGVLNNEGKIQGVITDGDVRRYLCKNESINGLLAVDLMSKKPKTIFENQSLAEAFEIMEQWRITSLFVIDKSQSPVGLLHMHDILERAI